jgi:hypothetical protein
MNEQREKKVAIIKLTSNSSSLSYLLGRHGRKGKLELNLGSQEKLSKQKSQGNPGKTWFLLGRKPKKTGFLVLQTVVQE